ncbi:MAG: NADH dehydrogenase I, D subunit [Actinobacteria bacterium 66_15]|nr:MAG: NADH dehydrogenase I, D subunit [Actinobacteria bacterium 66_15]
MRPGVDDIRTLVAAAGVAVEVEDAALGVVASVAAHDAIDALSAFSAGGYESLVDFDGIDTGEAIELTWRLRSYSMDCEAYLKTTVAYDAEIHSAWNVYPSALMPERETAELLGLRLAGHPNPKRLFTTDGIPPLLRKDVAIRSEEEVKNR